MKSAIFTSCIYLLLICIQCQAKVDLFITKEEMNRTLGLNSILRYVTDGSVNKYALGFPYMVRPNISWIVFWWQNKANYDIYYSLKVITLDKKAVIPGTDVTEVGKIPQSLEKFTISLQCTGKKKGAFENIIQLNYTWPSKKNQTTLQLLRRKICSLNNADPSLMNSGADQDPLTTPQNYITPNQIFYVAIGCVCGFVVVIASLIVAYFSRTKKSLQSNGGDPRHYAVSVASPGYSHQSQPFLHPESPSSGSKYSALTAGQSASIYSAIAGANTAVRRASPAPSSSVFMEESRDIDCQAALTQLRIDPACLEIGHVELEGTFGQVLLAFCRMEAITDTPAESAPVLVKTLKPTASDFQCLTFVREALFFHGIGPHPNVTQVVAACWADIDIKSPRPLLCYGHAGFGNLKKFLLRCRGVEPGSAHSLRTQDLVYMGVQIIRGMLHIHRNRIVHKDLATRNCLISENMTVQVCDPALSRDLFPQDYHCLGDNENRPIKWLALEALEKHEFSSASDVWSFGVTMWELLTCAQQPYMETEPEEICVNLKEGYRLSQPYNCPDELYGVIFCCWGQFTKSRPTFDQLLVALEDFYLQLTEYI